jgi:hypothetical protein
VSQTPETTLRVLPGTLEPTIRGLGDKTSTLSAGEFEGTGDAEGTALTLGLGVAEGTEGAEGTALTLGLGVTFGFGVAEGVTFGLDAGALPLFTQTVFLPTFSHLKMRPEKVCVFPTEEQLAPAFGVAA